MTTVTWTTQPARDRPLFGIGAATLVAVAGMLTGFATSVLVGAAAGVLLLLSLRHFFFPTTYVIDGDGVGVRCLGVETRRSWPILRSFHHDARGGFLSTRTEPSTLDSFTGLHLTWGDDRQSAIAAIESRMALLSHHRV